jgi:hypothetical protein
MKMKKRTVQLTAILMVVGLPAFAAASSPCSTSACKDSAAVSSLLLAAGMYGGIDAPGEFSLSRSASTFKSFASQQGTMEGQDITLSYEGSSGSRLGFSAGYLYAEAEEKREAGRELTDIDSYFNFQNAALTSDSTSPWYLTFNVAKEFQISDSLALGLDSKATLLSPSPLLNDAEEADSRAVCMSLNLPVSYGSFLTVTPELQWSRQLEPSQQAAGGSELSAASAAGDNADTFYGGMSITLSY